MRGSLKIQTAAHRLFLELSEILKSTGLHYVSFVQKSSKNATRDGLSYQIVSR